MDTTSKACSILAVPTAISKQTEIFGQISETRNAILAKSFYLLAISDLILTSAHGHHAGIVFTQNLKNLDLLENVKHVKVVVSTCQNQNLCATGTMPNTHTANRAMTDSHQFMGPSALVICNQNAQMQKQQRPLTTFTRLSLLDWGLTLLHLLKSDNACQMNGLDMNEKITISYT